MSCGSPFNIQDLVNTAWAFAKIGHYSQKLFSAVAEKIIDASLDELEALHIANIAWAYGKATDELDAGLSSQLFARLAKSAEQKVDDFSAKEIAQVAWAFANANSIPHQLFSSLAVAAKGFLEDFNDEELDNAEWAFAYAGQEDIVKLLRQDRQRSVEAAAALAATDVDVSKCGRIIIAGGGIGGAAIAVALQRKGFEVVVLEADASLDSRKQGEVEGRAESAHDVRDI